MAGAKLAARDLPLLDALSASDAPVVGIPGHRRGNVVLPNDALIAALPQPPSPLIATIGNRTRLFRLLSAHRELGWKRGSA